MSDFASRLRLLRNERGLRQKDLAGDLGLAQTTIANYEQGTRFPDEGLLIRLADYLDVSLDFLLGRTETRGVAAAVHKAASADPEELGPIARRYLELLLEGQADAAASLVLEEAQSGRDVRDIYTGILEPALVEVGTLWERGRLQVAQEHFVSETSERLMAELRPHFRRRASNGLTAIAISGGGESHGIGIRMVSDFLELDGWRTFFLGINVPTAEVIDTIGRWEASLLAVSVTLPAHVDAVSNLVAAVKAASFPRPVRVIVGGRVFRTDPDALKSVPADGFAPDAEGAVRLARRLFSLQ